MVELGIIPRVSVVAVFTGITAGDVVCRLTLGDCTVVTRAARAEHGIVVDPSHVLECRGRVTIFADIRGVNVRGIFARGVHTIVT